MCLEWSKVEAEDAARLLCLSIAKKRMSNTPAWRDSLALGRDKKAKVMEEDREDW